jgi:WD40-like Beta Propeller Repeat
VTLPGPYFLPMFSPDGKELAFLTWLGQPDFIYANCHIAIVELAKVLDKAAAIPSDVRDLTAKFDEDPSPVGWGPDGIYFTAYQKTNVDLFRTNPQTGDIRQITSPESLVIEPCRSREILEAWRSSPKTLPSPTAI